MRGHARAAAASGAGVIVLVWGLYLANLAFGFHLGNAPATPEAAESERTAYLIMACVVTAAAAPLSFVAARNFTALARQGVGGWARVVKISSLGGHGNTPVTFAYEVGGKVYQKRLDVPSIFASRYELSTRLPVVYLPGKPGRCVIGTDPDHAAPVGPARDARGAAAASTYPQMPPGKTASVMRAAAEGALEGAVEEGHQFLLLALIAANVAAVGGACYLFGSLDTIRDYVLAIFFAGMAMALAEQIAIDRYFAARRPARVRRSHTFQWVGFAACLIGVVVIVMYVRDQNQKLDQAVRQQMTVP